MAFLTLMLCPGGFSLVVLATAQSFLLSCTVLFYYIELARFFGTPGGACGRNGRACLRPVTFYTIKHLYYIELRSCCQF